MAVQASEAAAVGTLARPKFVRAFRESPRGAYGEAAVTIGFRTGVGGYELCELLGVSLNMPVPKSWLHVIVVFVSWHDRLCGNTICWLVGSVSPRRVSLTLTAFAQPA